MTQVRVTPGNAVFPGAPDAFILIECYVPEHDVCEAIETARRALLKQGYELLDVTRCLMCDLNDEPDPEDESARTVAERVTNTGEVEFGPVIFSNP